MAENCITKVNIKERLSSFNDNREQCGFEAYVVTKTEPRMRRIALADELSDDEEQISFKKKIRNMLLDVLSEKYLQPDVEYAPASSIADDQHKMYLIPQDAESYKPFHYLDSDPTDFKDGDLEEATGLAFLYRKGGEMLWLYQHLWAILVPKKKKSPPMARILHFENGIVFHEQKDDLLTIARKIDLVVIGGVVVTENISLMQKSFGFQDFIRATAEKTIERITQNGIVQNVSKLTEYINRGKPKYAKKLMRIADSKVLLMTPAQLIEKIDFVERWKGIFTLCDNHSTIQLLTFTHVESLIDLLDERYTKSEITDTEYDTDVKQVASPVIQESA